MAKRKKHRVDPAAKFALIFALVIVVAVSILIPVMTRYSQRKLEENIAKAEAERQYLLDTSWLDSEYSLTWLAERDHYELEAEGDWDYIDSDTLLRSFDFTGHSFSDIPMELGKSGDLIPVPSDDPRGYVLAEEEGDLWSIFRVDENGKPVRLLREKNKNISDIFGFYNGKLYCDVYTDGEELLGFETCLFSWDSETGQVFQYRDNALCVGPDGRAVIEIERDTGLYETYLSMYDDEGKRRDKPVEERIPIMGGTLGIEDGQGNWQPLLNTGKDGMLYAVDGVVWMDADRLLLAARTLPGSSCTLYICTLSRGEISLFTAETGEAVYLKNQPAPDSLTVSPDGRFIAYRIWDNVFKYDGPDQLIVQSLETGRCVQLSPRDAVIDGDQKTSVNVCSDVNYPIWTQ